MKKLIVILLLCVTPVAFAGWHSSPPRDGGKMDIVATGSANQVFYMASDTDGAWQEVTLPTGTECKAVLIQVHAGTDTDYEGATLAGFLFSHETAGDFIISPSIGLVRSIGVIAADSTSLGFVKAATGAKIAVMILY